MSKVFETNDPIMKNILGLIENVALSKATVLITGDSGVGKERISQYIHSSSNRSANRFTAVNCAALPENLLESELFGYEKGAFTGATQSKPGKIEIANGGTFLLDEISEMPLALQGKLLRVLQEREVERLGSCKTTKIDVRFLCTSNRDLRSMVKEGRFRKDLYYRINVVPINVPSLSERPQDILLYAEKFLFSACNENNFSQKVFDKSAREKLLSWTWPGNVRELANVIERTVLNTPDSTITDNNLLIDGYQEKRQTAFGPGMTVSEAEKLLIMKTLNYTNNNKTQASRLLGISIRTLRNKLNEYKKEIGYESSI